MVEGGHSKWLLLVHDKRDSSAVPFDAIIAATPKELMKARGAGGIYDTVHSPCWPAHRSQRRAQLWFAQVATDLYAGEHEAVSLRLLLAEIAPKRASAQRRGWMAMPFCRTPGRLTTLESVSASFKLRPAYLMGNKGDKGIKKVDIAEAAVDADDDNRV